MKYYFKHLRRLILRRPLQPLVVVLVLLFSFAVQFVSVAASNGIKKDNDLKNAAAGVGSVTVTPADAAAWPFVTDSAVKNAYPDAAVTGIISIPLVMGQDVVQGYALDWDTVDTVFPQSFAAPQALNDEERADALFVTADFAKTYGVAVGDEVTFRLYGYDITFTVRGTFDTPILSNGDVTCDLQAALRAYVDAAGLSAFFTDASLSGVYGKLYVRSETMTTEELTASLAALYPDMIVEPVPAEIVADGFDVFTIIPAVIIAFTFFIALVVSTSCLWCMARQRHEYARLFSLVGFPARQALLCRILEMLFYTVPAIGLGLLLSLPMGRTVFAQMELRFVSFRVTPGALVPAALSLFCIAVFSPLLAEVSWRRGRKRFGVPAAVLCGLGAVLTAAVSFFVPATLRFYVAMPSLLLIFLTLILSVKPLVVALAERGVLRRGRAVARTLARRNGRRVGELANATRLLAFLLVALSCLWLLSFSSQKSMKMTNMALKGDYVISGTEQTLQAVKSAVDALEETESSYLVRVWDADTADTGYRFYLIGVSDTSVLGYEFGDALALPGDGEVVSAAFITDSRGLPVGEDVTVTDGVNTLSLYLTQTLATGMPQQITNYDTLTYGTTYLMVTGAEGVSSQALLDALSGATQGQMLSILPKESLFTVFMQDLMRYVCFIRYMMVLLTVFALIGVGNNLAESVRSRRGEFTELRLCGMARVQVVAMALYENLYVVLIALAAALPFILFAWPVMNQALYTYSCDPLQILWDVIRLGA